MTDRYWRKGYAGRLVWEYCKDRRNPFNDNPQTYVVGYIIKKKNKHRCRDWLVYWYPASWTRTYIGHLKDMKHPEAKLAAQLLIGAQHD